MVEKTSYTLESHEPLNPRLSEGTNRLESEERIALGVGIATGLEEIYGDDLTEMVLLESLHDPSPLPPQLRGQVEAFLLDAVKGMGYEITQVSDEYEIDNKE